MNASSEILIRVHNARYPQINALLTSFSKYHSVSIQYELWGGNIHIPLIQHEAAT